VVSVTPSLDEAADQPRDQASCRRPLTRLSESDAIRIERPGNNASDGDNNSHNRLLAALAWQDALWLRKRPFASRRAIAFSIGELDG